MTIREAQIDAMAAAGQKLAVRWGHQPWSDSWARQVAITMLTAAIEAPVPVAASSSLQSPMEDS